MAAVGDLVRCTDGSWMTRPPQSCVTPASPSSVRHRRSPTRLPQATIELILELRQRLVSKGLGAGKSNVAMLPWLESTAVLRV
jgi:hypothetical protein